MPPVRGKSVKIDVSKKVSNSFQEKTTSEERMKNNKCAPRSYSDWDKFNVDEELKKLEGTGSNKTSKEEKKKLEKSPGLSKCISVSGLSEKECKYVAEMEKNKGNEAFKAGDFEEAVLYYTRSLSALRTTITLNNRAQAYIKLKNYLAAAQDCTEVISLEPSNIKALYRRGIAYKAEGIIDLAKLDFKIILEIDPENKLAKEQLKKIKRIKLPKTENKKLLIEEVKTDENGNVKNHSDDKSSATCTRLKIEEVNCDSPITELTNLNYSSDEDDDTLQLPQKVKQMLKIHPRHNKQKGISDSACANEIDKKPVGNKTRDVTKPKIVEVGHEFRSNSKVESVSNSKKYDKHGSEYVNVKIEDHVSNAILNPMKIQAHNIKNNEPEGISNKTEQRKNVKIEESDDIKNKICDPNIREISANLKIEEVNNDENSMKFHSSNNKKVKDMYNEKTTKVNTSEITEVDAVKIEISEKCINVRQQENVKNCTKENAESDIKNSEESIKKYNTTNQATYEKITPYEFLCAWWSSDAASDMKTGAEYLLKIQPQELPDVISNKLDTSVLCGLLRAIAGIFKMGRQTEGDNYLYYLIKVPRIKVIAMLLSDDEVKGIQCLFSTLEKEYGIQSKSVNQILQL